MVMLNLLLMFVFIYMIIPYVITRIWGFGVTLRGRRGRQIALPLMMAQTRCILLNCWIFSRKRIKVTFLYWAAKRSDTRSL